MSAIDDHVLHILLMLIAAGVWPDSWKTSVLCPIPKIRDVFDFRRIFQTVRASLEPPESNEKIHF